MIKFIYLKFMNISSMMVTYIKDLSIERFKSCNKFPSQLLINELSNTFLVTYFGAVAIRKLKELTSDKFALKNLNKLLDISNIRI